MADHERHLGNELALVGTDREQEPEHRMALGPPGVPFLVEWFTLPEASWWDSYYGPLSKRLAEYEASSGDEPQAVSGMTRREIDVYRKFSRWYDYAFFLLRIRS